MRRNPEETLYRELAFYMKQCWPSVIYRFDYGGGLFMGWKAATLQRDIQHGRAYPDFFIAEPQRFLEAAGLFLELKPYKTRLTKKTGEWVDWHIQEQAERLKELQERGYVADFAIGIDDAIEKIEKYLNNTNAKRSKKSIRF